jgi:hypothetical protein
MSGSEEIDKKSIQDVLNKINESWLQKNYDLMFGYLADNVVMVPPGSSERIKGKEAYVQSYRTTMRLQTQRNFIQGILRLMFLKM